MQCLLQTIVVRAYILIFVNEVYHILYEIINYTKMIGYISDDNSPIHIQGEYYLNISGL